ncbi:unnamed protein product [Phytophthora lilii]|uniref:Unnamed protein product n=1 Tax=Phytophthora lilii TaxID=2077276 RepID=A0A9W7D8P7_9STRA|nr:unnamed protein product [Phytophthora lilii]
MVHHCVSICCWASALLLLAISAGATSLGSDELWRTADRLWQAGDLDSALAVMQQIVTLQPEDRPARLGIASIYRRRKELDSALEILEALLVQEPYDPLLLQRIGEVYSDKGDISTALEYLHAAEREIGPNDVERADMLSHTLALVYHHSGYFAKALKFFNRVGESGRSAAFYFDFGVTLEKVGKARMWLTTVLKKEQNSN